MNPRALTLPQNFILLIQVQMIGSWNLFTYLENGMQKTSEDIWIGLDGLIVAIWI
jgi:hypothetical protein